MVMDPTLPRISVRDLMMQAFLTGWELSDKTVSQDEYLQSSIQGIEVLQGEPESLDAEEGLGLPDGEEVDHLDDWLRADGKWLYFVTTNLQTGETKFVETEDEFWQIRDEYKNNNENAN